MYLKIPNITIDLHTQFKHIKRVSMLKKSSCITKFEQTSDCERFCLTSDGKIAPISHLISFNRCILVQLKYTFILNFFVVNLNN